MDSSEVSFAPAELEQALKEQAYGISSYEISKKSPMESIAEVITLEGEHIRLCLTPRGYEVSSIFST